MDGAPETIVAVLVYSVRYGLNSELTKDICRWTKLVTGIKAQLGRVSTSLLPTHGDFSIEDFRVDTDAAIHR